MFTKQSLETLKEKVDIVELVGSYVQLKGAGAMHKGLCPFHQEKSPSFTVQRASGHYHCFGCGAHGDAISFLMNHLSLSFLEAVQVLADKYNVTLEEADGPVSKGPSKAKLREQHASVMRLMHAYLLGSPEGKRALEYLYKRGIDNEFISTFKVGLCPREETLFYKLIQKLKFEKGDLETLGLLRNNRPLFTGRILFPIVDALGNNIGFSGRKIEESQFGPKYINTPETHLFKKSSTLYGLDRSRKRIAKEKRAIIVEGQIDALRLIQEGFNFTVAGQGTAFTEEQRKLLIDLGVETVFLGMDGDFAGKEAAIKIGNMFQKVGVEVYVLPFGDREDPDTILQADGPEGIEDKLKTAKPYLEFLFDVLSRSVNLSSPSAKNTLVQKIASQIRTWDHPLMVHESLRKLAGLSHVPEELIGATQKEASRNYYVKKTASLQGVTIDPDRILDTDLMRWLFFAGDKIEYVLRLITTNISTEHLKLAVARRLYALFVETYNKGEQTDLLSIATKLENPEDQLYLTEMTQKKVNTDKIEEGLHQTVQKILERHWFEQRERIRLAIQSGVHSDEEVLELAKQFDALKKLPPEIRETVQ